jgi:hypothetical protein
MAHISGPFPGKDPTETAMSEIKAENTAVEGEAHVVSRTSFRTWAITLGVSGAMLVTMYALAFWHEARAEAARTAAPAAVSTPVH